MSQWQQIQMLERVYLEQVHRLYSDEDLPMEVRQYLAYWIEEQNWSQAVHLDPSQACCLFHTMLALLDDQLGRLVLGEENNSNMVLKHNLRRSKLFLQAKYQDKPEQLANVIANLLKQEELILSEALAASQRRAQPQPNVPVTMDHEHNIEDRLMEMRKTIQGLKTSAENLEDLQDTFDFRFKTYKILERMTSIIDPVQARRHQELQLMINNLDSSRKDILDRIQDLLGRSDTLRGLLLEQLAAWQDRQRQACMGATCDTSLGQLEKWFTACAEDLFNLLQLLQSLEELYKKVTYEQDPLKEKLPLQKKRLQEQLTCLLKSAFVVENQPKMPHPARRPLVLRTSNKFSVRVRLLVKLLERDNNMEVKIEIDRDAANLSGFRRFNILTSKTKTLECLQTDGLVCDFKYIMLKEQKISTGKGKGGKGINEAVLTVPEELHIITFTLDYCYHGLKCQLQTSTLPVVIISNTNQMSSAWASILWFIMLSTDPMNQRFFTSPPAALWSQLSTVLSWQFKDATEKGLNSDQLKMLGEKLCGSNVTPQSTITWDQFAKDTASSFSFWTWIDGILLLIQEHLLQLWQKDLIMGFVSRKREKHLLKRKRSGTFLLRFSESIANGAITCTWVEHDSEGSAKFSSVQPYTKEELKFLALPDIIHSYQLLAEEDIPENPLQYLYPDTPRDEAFGPYYSEHREADLTAQKKYLNRRLIRVSCRQPGEAETLEMNGLPTVHDVPLTNNINIISENAISENPMSDIINDIISDNIINENIMSDNINGVISNNIIGDNISGVLIDNIISDNISDNNLSNTIDKLEQDLSALFSNKQDPFLPLPGEDQDLAQLHSELFETHDMPELKVDEEDFQC